MPMWAFPVLCLCLLLSGFAGLLYETLWARFLYHYLGNTSHAHAIVLSVFMGGIALGSATLGRWADRLARKTPPLDVYLLVSAYAWIEILIGFYCGIYPDLYERLSAHYTVIGERWYERIPAAVTVLKIGFAVSTMLIPTFLMGGTIPILVRLFGPERNAVGRTAGWLNAANTVGAVVGTLLAGFYLIEKIGLSLSMYVGAFTNLAAGILVLVLRKKITRSVRPSSAHTETENRGAAYSTGQQAIALAGIFLSGFASFALEVLWARIIGLSLGSSVYAFSIMLATFILGIALGSFVVGLRFLRRFDALQLFLFAEFGIGISLLAIYPLFQDLPLYFAHLRLLLVPTGSSFWLYNMLTSIALYAVLFAPTVLIGATFPLAAAVSARAPETLGRRIGHVLFWNTLGNLSGALAAATLMIPWFGLERAVEIVIALNFGAGLLLWAGWAKQFSLIFAAAGLAALFLAPAAMRTVEWSPSILQSGAFRNRGAPPAGSIRQWKRELEKAGQILYLKDDPNGTVSILRSPDGEVSLRVGAKTDASSYSDLPTEILSAHIPMMLQPRAEEILVIGMGSGITASSVLLYPGTSVQQVEISPAVVEASRHFEQHNRFVHSNPRLRIQVEDAKTYLKLTSRDFDVIISEPSNPWMAGVAGLFSKEFFEEARSHLRPGGLMVQWFHLYEMDDYTLSTILNTFGSIFPHVTVWNTLAPDLLMVGSERALQPDFEYIRAQFDNSALREDLARVQVSRPSLLLALQAVPERAFRNFVDPDHPVHTDDAPLLDYAAARNFYTGARTSIRDHDARSQPLDSGGLFLARYFKTYPMVENDLVAILQYYLSRGVEAEEVIPLLIRTMKTFPPGLDYRLDLFRIGHYNRANQPEIALELIRHHLQKTPERWNDQTLVHFLIEALMKNAEASASWVDPRPLHDALDAVAGTIPKSGVEQLQNWNQLGQMARRFGRHEVAVKAFLTAAQQASARKQPRDGFLALASLSLFEEGKRAQAAQLAQGALDLNPRNAVARTVLRRLDETK